MSSKYTAPLPPIVSQVVKGSFEQVCGGRQSQRPATSGAEQAGRAKDECASQPRCSPIRQARLGLCDEAPQEVVGEQLDQEHGVVGVEALARDFAEAEPVFEIADDGLDFCAPVVLEGDFLGRSEPIVGDVELHGLVWVVPDAELLPGATLGGAQGDDPERELSFAPLRADEGQHGDSQLMAYSDLLRGAWPEIQGKTGLTMVEIQEAKDLGAALVEAAGLHDLSTAEVAETARIRQQAFTLLSSSYAETRRCLQYLRFHQGDADTIAPSFFIGRTKRSAVEPAPAPAPTPVPAPTPEPPVVTPPNGGNPSPMPPVPAPTPAPGPVVAPVAGESTTNDHAPPSVAA